MSLHADCGEDKVFAALENVRRIVFSGAHIISSPLPAAGDVSLKWFQCWNGEDQQLVRLLQQAETDYFMESSVRDKAIQQVKQHFSLHAVSAKLDHLLRTVAAKGTETYKEYSKFEAK